MTRQNFLKTRLYCTAIIAIVIWSLLVWDHFHGGVPSHHVLHREDLPAFSNWWGGFLIPLLTWFLFSRIQGRISKNSALDTTIPANVFYGFLSALIFGILLSIFFTAGFEELPLYMIIGLILTSLFLPIYRAECFLGFVVGMIYTFGGVLPILIVSILTLLGAILYLIVRSGVLFIILKVSNLKIIK